jgi:hypothetical protein
MGLEGKKTSDNKKIIAREPHRLAGYNDEFLIQIMRKSSEIGKIDWYSVVAGCPNKLNPRRAAWKTVSQ